MTFASGPISGSAAGFENRDLPLGPDDHHGVVERVEDRGQPVALRATGRRTSPAGPPASSPARVPSSVISSRPPGPTSGSSSRPSVIRAALSARRLTREVIAVAIRNPITTAIAIATPCACEPIAAQRLDRLGDLLRSLGASEQGAGEPTVSEHRRGRQRDRVGQRVRRPASLGGQRRPPCGAREPLPGAPPARCVASRGARARRTPRRSSRGP